MIPFSLKVTTDCCKYLISVFIGNDIELYDAPSDTRTNVSNTATCEDLGQIEYIFSDKTGTLTTNVMTFNKCILQNRTYGKQDAQIIAKALASHDEYLIKFMETLVLCNSVFSSIE